MKTPGQICVEINKGDTLLLKVAENRRKIADLLHGLSRRAPDQWFDLHVALILIGHHALDGLEAPGLLRQWEYDPHKYGVVTTEPSVPPMEIPAQLSRWSELAFHRLKNSSGIENRRTVAGIEWDLAIGPIHPFYDACGRISRYFAALLCIWNAQPIPVHDSRDEYMKAAQGGKEQFVEYWTARPGQLHAQ